MLYHRRSFGLCQTEIFYRRHKEFISLVPSRDFDSYKKIGLDRVYAGGAFMKALGFLLLPAGWAIALAAVVLLRMAPQRAGFVFAGMGVEALGVILVVRAHLLRRGDDE